MKREAWPIFSITDVLRPPEGWLVDHAILTSYSADLVVVVTALLALSDCDMDYRRTGSRVELVKAVESLRGKVKILTQANRITVPKKAHSILRLMDHFLKVIPTDERQHSWHPKIFLVRFHRDGDRENVMWRVWLGSKNLTAAMNWDVGLMIASRTDKGGASIPGLAELGFALAQRSGLPALKAADVQKELSSLTWDCPSGCEIRQIKLLLEGDPPLRPQPPPDTTHVLVVSPFLDTAAAHCFVREIAEWGGTGTHRTLISTTPDLQRLWDSDRQVFSGFNKVCSMDYPDLPEVGGELASAEAPPAALADGEEPSPLGLHAKIILATSRSQRRLWVGSANATRRAWSGRNYEVIAEAQIDRNIADALQEFAAGAVEFKPSTKIAKVDELEDKLEHARQRLSNNWTLQQRLENNESLVIASRAPALSDLGVQVECAALGGAWVSWPDAEERVLLEGNRLDQRSNLLQIRLMVGDRQCSWLQFAACTPEPDVHRDRAIIAQYLDPRAFLLWVRSLLNNEAPDTSDSDWDESADTNSSDPQSNITSPDATFAPNLEDILRAWARDPEAFRIADEKVTAYLSELSRRAEESNRTQDLKLLKDFEASWSTLAIELR